MSRLRQRRSNGRFRYGTLVDIGMSCCPKCGTIYRPDLAQLKGERFIDPCALSRALSTCPICDGGNGEVTGLVAVAPADEVQS